MSVSAELKQAVPSLVTEGDEPVFNEPWEARAFAMAVKLNEAGVFTWSEWAEQFGAAIAENTKAGEPHSYYQVWMATLEAMAGSKGLASDKERAVRYGEWEDACERTPHGEPIEL